MQGKLWRVRAVDYRWASGRAIYFRARVAEVSDRAEFFLALSCVLSVL